jgi:microcystin-dependent protein
MEPFIGQIIMFAGTYAPRGWALCNGQLLPIASYQALFSLLGTNYGGDGRTTFGLPDLRGRYAMHAGQGPGLSSRVLGQSGGAESTMLNASNVAAHTHPATLHASGNAADTANPTGSNLGLAEAYSQQAASVDLASDAVTTENNSGGSAAFNNMPPYQTINFCIALEGIYPPRN